MFYVGFLLSAAAISYFIKAIIKGIVTHIYGNDINGLLLSYGLSVLVILVLTYMMSNIDTGMMYLFLMIVFIFLAPYLAFHFFQDKKEQKMPWFHWMSAIMMIGGMAFFIIIPGKPLYYLIGNITVIAIGYLIATHVPEDIFKKKEKG